MGVVGENRHLYDALWRSWGENLVATRPDIDAEQLEQFGTRMWDDGEFVVSVGREFVRACSTPLLVLPGIDDYHPTATGREVARAGTARRGLRALEGHARAHSAGRRGRARVPAAADASAGMTDPIAFRV